MKHILSIQSHVVYGYVGNRAAVFPLQRIGLNVSALNTVQFSNHTGYGHWHGDVFSGEHIASLYEGLTSLGVASQYDAMLTGYMGSPETGKQICRILLDLKANNERFMYCCDPVIGDVGRGIFVRPGVGEFFRDELIQHATILTPNQFELTYLTGIDIHTLDDVKRACRQLLDKGIKNVLVTSVTVDDLPADKIGIMLCSEHNAYLVTTQRLQFDVPPNGAGDISASLFLGHLLKGEDERMALIKTAQALFTVFRNTHKQGERELSIIESQDAFDSVEHPDIQLEMLS